MKSLLIILITISPFVFAETGYRYVAPNSDYGKLCVNQCDNSKYQCQQLEQLKKENSQLKQSQEGLNFKQNVSADFQRCLTKHSKEKCRDREDTDLAIDLFANILGAVFEEEKPVKDICKERYLQCFNRCGGVIEKVKFDSY